MTVKGIDVSSYQSSTFATSGLSFVFVKATEGTSYIASTQTAQAAHARAAGCVVGFYHFLHPGNAKAQAAYFVAKCASVAGDILACDWEPTSSGTPSNADKDAFIKEVKRLRPDHKVVLYCDVSRWHSDTTNYCGDGLWIADPNHAAGKPGVTHAWTFHQYGISGTDVNVGNFASKAALATWATGTPPAPPKPPKPAVKVPAFPGTKWFGAGQNNKYVTELGQALVKKGFGKHYTSGPGPKWSDADRQNCAAFQRSRHELASDPDGYPGPLTWRLLFS